VEQTLFLETPNGAFSYAGKIWVFAGIADPQFSGHRRPHDPAPGCYLLSKDRPDLPGIYQKEFLFSPRIGWCPHDASRDRFESHEPLGFKFVLPHDLPEDANHQANWRFCVKCAALFWNGDAENKGQCWRGGSHEAAGLNFVLSHSRNEDSQNQANWRRCNKCYLIFWNGDPSQTGLCPGGSTHEAIGFNLLLPHNVGEGPRSQGGWRFCIKCHSAVWTRQEDRFPWVAPWVVRNVDHPGLPPSPHEHGLVMFGFGFSPVPGIRLAWMPLKTPIAPMLQDILYYTGIAGDPWSNNYDAAIVILPHANTYTHLSAAWLEGPKRWILLYSNADNNLQNPANFRRPAVARIGTTLWNWSEEIEIFNPVREQAYGRYMHEIGRDTIYPDIPPQHAEHDGWAYRAFLLNRFTEWNATTRELAIYYLLSLSSPYQVQLMHTRLIVPE
jgi:hypothetical protein